MKLIEGIKNKGFPFVIPDNSRDELPGLFKELGFNVGAEIGVWEGCFLEKFCKEGFKMYGVDHWLARGRQSQRQNDNRYERAKQRLSAYDCQIIRKASTEALKDFKDESLDFVYIDADHHYRTAYEDIEGWGKKVRKGGIIAGHDYTYRSLEETTLSQAGRALNDFLKKNKIDNFYAFGMSNPISEIGNDQCLSWMFIKQ